MAKVKLLLALLTIPMLFGCEKVTERGTAVDETDEEQHNAKSSEEGLVFDAKRRREAGVETTPIARQRRAKSIQRIGWLVAPPASETVIRSPVAGFVVPQTTQQWPQPGQAVDSMSALAQINVFLTPQEISQMVLAKEDNDIQMQQALVTMELSEAQLKLATSARDAVTGVRIDQLKEAYERSKAAYKEAQDKLPFLIQEPYDNGVILKPVPVQVSPSGRILQIFVAQGQFVQTGDPLWTVGDWTTLWVRVPLFTGELKDAMEAIAANVEPGVDFALIPASPLNIPTPADPQTRTVDLFFSVSNPEWKLRVGQSVTMNISLNDESNVLVIPQSAVLYDSFGQAFCYSGESGSDAFERRRLEIGGSTDSGIIVLRGLDEDDVIVSVGAEQLAAEESKSELAVEDDD